jgi:DNA-binding MarR family transcriptional regulator
MAPRHKAASNAAPDTADYQSRVGYLIGAISNLLTSGGSRLFRRAYGLSFAEARLMYVLGYESVLTAQQASRIIGVDKAATSRVLASLARRGLVKVIVDPGDARQRLIEFTRPGKELQERLTAVILQREAELISIFSRTEARTIVRLLKRLVAHVPAVRGRTGERR